MSTPPREIMVTCPKCENTYQDWIRDSMNLSLEPFDDDYIDQASSAVCPKCKHKVYFGTLVVDKDGVMHVPAGGEG